MKDKRASYARLPGRRTFFFERCSLWQGPDHLLWVQGNMMQEHYKRFYFQDIQAVILRHNQRRLIWALVWGTLAVLTGALGAFLSEYESNFFFYASLWSPFLICNHLFGPGCDVFIQTPVHLEKISTLVRVKASVKVLDRIREMAETSQGQLDGKALTANGGIVDGRRSRPAPSFDADGTVKAGEHGSGSLLLPRSLAVLLLILGLLGFFQLHQRWLWLGVLDLFLLLCLLGLAILVLVRGHRSTWNPLPPLLSWLSLSLAALRGAISYIYFIVVALQHPESSYNTGLTMKHFLELQIADHPWTAVIGYASASAALVLGIACVAALLVRGRRRQADVMAS
jgi:hypothetical protein